MMRDGGRNLSVKSSKESQPLFLGMKAKEPRTRLACQARLVGDAVAERRGVYADA